MFPTSHHVIYELEGPLAGMKIYINVLSWPAWADFLLPPVLAAGSKSQPQSYGSSCCFLPSDREESRRSALWHGNVLLLAAVGWKW